MKSFQEELPSVAVVATGAPGGEVPVELA